MSEQPARYWNYRVVHRYFEVEDYHDFFIIEAYYQNDILTSYSRCVPGWETIEELEVALRSMAEAYSNRAVVEYHTLPGKK